MNFTSLAVIALCCFSFTSALFIFLQRLHGDPVRATREPADLPGAAYPDE